ncbi:IPT/TIG domain-containing protein [Neorhizobium sp. NPDC001467]|uniref:IPT/TIG domain-containing protein n=1 Tax=Neorhizobium sp. NPDC001467 TaxID=3390595 RepID=UPI003D03D119
MRAFVWMIVLLFAGVQATLASQACSDLTTKFGTTQVYGPDDDNDNGDFFDDFEDGETLWYQAQTFGSSAAELDPMDDRNIRARFEVTNLNINPAPLVLVEARVVDRSVTGTLELTSAPGYEIYAQGGSLLDGGTGSLRFRMICSGATTTVSGLTPTSGSAIGGTPVTITGTNVAGITSVTFDGVAATGLTVVDAQTITAIAPAHAAGEVDVAVARSTGGPIAAGRFTYIAVPTVTSLLPLRGSTAGGTEVVITGTAFTGVSGVSFGGTAATSYTFDSDTQITAVAPAGSAGSVTVAVTTPGGTSTAGAGSTFSYVAAPTISSLTPAQGPSAGGNSVIIAGSNFVDVTAVEFGGVPATSFNIGGVNQITAQAPAGAPGGVSIIVTALGGTSAARPYTYVAAPTVNSVTPTEGPVAGGTSVTITGTNLTGATVTLNGTPVPFTSNTATEVVFTTPPAAAGSAAISVTTAGGTAGAGSFTYRPLPSISGLSPASGPLAGGTSVVIAGSDLAGATGVTFNGVAATIQSVSATAITVTAPGGAEGPVNVAVTTAGGTSVASAASTFTYVAAPEVSSLSPTAGPLAGGTAVTITGTRFTPDATVTFGGVPATSISFNSATSLTAISPAGSEGSVDVIVTTLGGASTGGVGRQFTYVTAPGAVNTGVVVAANSTNAPVAPVTSGGTPDSVAVVTPTTSGSIAAAGASFVYTPNPGFSGTDSFTFTATNAGGTSAPATITITVTAPTLVLTPAPGALPSGQVGTAYSQTFAAASGTTPYAYAITVGAAPAGLTLDGATGALAGTPTVAGTFSFTVTATDTYGASGSAAYTLTVAEQAPIANAATATVAIGSSNNVIALNITGGAATSVAVSTPAANGSAVPSGTSILYTPAPGYSGPDTFAYTATNAGGTSGPATVTITVAAPTFTFTPPGGALTTATQGISYTQTIATGGGNGNYSYAVTAGALPAGLTLSSAGVISGTPTTVENAAFTITATDTTGAFGVVSYTLAVVLPPPTAGNVSLTVAANSSATPLTLALSGGAATSITVNTPPARGSVSISGTTLSYTPSPGYSGTDGFTYSATNASGTSAPATVTITVTAPTLALSPPAGALPGGTVAIAYSQTFVAANGTAPYSYTVSSGAVPPGITLDPTTGALAGTPSAVGTSTFTVTATDTFGATGSSSYTLAIAERLPVANPVTATVVRGSVNNPITLSITGGPATTVAVTAGPSNGSVNVAGTAITYTPTGGFVGTDSFDYTASNASGASAPATVSITVANPVLTLAPAAGPLPDGTLGAAYSQTLSASGGTAPYGFTVTGGALPPGLAIASGSNVIAGTPTVAGTYSLSITATDAGGATGVVSYSLRIQPAALVLSPPNGSALPPATVNAAYSYAGINATGGSGPASFSATGLPAGLVIAANGAISGTPSVSGRYTPTVTATDPAGAVATATYDLVVNAAASTFVFTPAGGALPPAMPGEAYSQDISAGGGTAPLIYRLAAGSLPAGLVLNVSNGDLNGPLAADAAPDTYNFTIEVRDASGATGSASFTLQVQPRAVTVANKEVSVAPGGTPPNVYLNSGATGGPFVDAVLADVSPPSAGTAEIIRGELAQTGPVAPTGFYLRFTPNPGFSGRAVVGYRLVSALGTSNVGTVAYNLNFNAAVVAEDIDKLVHDFVRTRQNLLASTIKVPGLLERRRMENARDPVTIRMSPQEDGMRAAFSTSLVQMEAARDRADGLDAAESRRFNVWIDGAIRAHAGGDDDDEDDRWGSFALLSVGMDYLLSDRALIGISAHFDRMTDPADEDAELTGNGWFAGPYLSMEIANGIFFDTSLLYGGSWNDIDTPFFEGKFDTTRWMFDGSIKGEWYLDEATVVTPKLRAVYLTETVKDYAVSNDAGDRLLLEGFSMEQLRASIGAEVERRIVLSNGMVLTPSLGATVGFAGLDGEGTFATVTAGVSLQTEAAWMFDVAVLFDIEGEGDVSVGARARVSARF